MKRDLNTVLSEIQKGGGSPLLLLYGDDFQVHAATQALLDLLVPPDRRAFNLERFDGRSSPWEEIEAALMTPPFFSGKKTVLVENAPYFFSREQRGELGERVLRLWQEGKKEEAARLFLDLLLVEGWTEEQWERAEGALPASQMNALFGDQEMKEEVEGLIAFCRTAGMGLRGRRGAEGNRLMELLEKGPPPWALLLITASHVDRRTRLFKRLEEKGGVLDLSLERDRKGRVSRENLAEFLDRRLNEAGKKIAPQAREMILQRAGDELWSFHQELEKLLLYTRDNPSIRAADVEESFPDRGEGWVFDLTAAVAERDALAALGHLAKLLAQGEHPLRLLGAITGELRKLLQARQLIDGEMRQSWDRGMSYPQFQAKVLRGGPPLLTRNPYADYMTFKRADNFTARELLTYLEWMFKTDIRLKSSAFSPSVVMERLILEMCQSGR